MFNDKNKTKVIYLDIDDTLGNTRGAFISLYEEITKEKGNYDIKTKNYEELFPLWNDDVIESIFKGGNVLYDKVQPFEGAKEAVEDLLRKGYEIKIATMYENVETLAKLRWVEKHFPELKDKVYFIPYRDGNKNCLTGFSIVDDDIKNLCSTSIDTPILLDFFGVYDEIPLRFVTKCKSWREVVNKL